MNGVILIVGGGGFIGSNLAAALEARGERVAVCDTLGTLAKWRNLAKRELDALITPEQLEGFLQVEGSRLGALIHLAAPPPTREADPDVVAEVSFRLARTLWLWCRDHETRFLYASAASTYGDGTNGFRDDDSPEALAPLRPLSPAAWSKHAFDRWVARQRATTGAKTPPQSAGLKIFSAYGPNEYHKESRRSVVIQAFPYAQRSEPFPLFTSYHPDYANGRQKRDFVWVGDVVRVMLWLLDSPSVNGLFNCGTGTARTFVDAVGTMYQAIGKSPLLRVRDMPEELRAKYQYVTEADLTKLRAAGYTAPFASLEEGIGLYVRNFLAAADPYV